MTGPHESFPIDRDMEADVSPPTAFPVSSTLRPKLSRYLSQFPFVHAAYLAQFVYVGEIDARVGTRPCLTVGVVVNTLDGERLVTELSRGSGPVVSGELGEWRFLDWYPVTPARERAFANAGPPFFVRS